MINLYFFGFSNRDPSNSHIESDVQHNSQYRHLFCMHSFCTLCCFFLLAIPFSPQLIRVVSPVPQCKYVLQQSVNWRWMNTGKISKTNKKMKNKKVQTEKKISSKWYANLSTQKEVCTVEVHENKWYIMNWYNCTIFTWVTLNTLQIGFQSRDVNVICNHRK